MLYLYKYIETQTSGVIVNSICTAKHKNDGLDGISQESNTFIYSVVDDQLVYYY